MGPGPIQRPLQNLSVNNSYPGSALTPTASHSTSDDTTNTDGTSKSSTPQPQTWASMTATPFIPSTSPDPRPPKSNVKAAPEVHRNRHGQRIDDLDDGIPHDELRRVKKLKLCNVHFLGGQDGCTSSRCTHDHDYKITKTELRTLRQVAKMTPCFYKSECDDPKCIYGHRCPQSQPDQKECWYKDQCRFYGWGHGVDTRVVKTTKV